jgi:hypothetical protein
MDRCPHCGVVLPAIRDAFCPECRQRLDELPSEPLPVREPPFSAPLTKYPVGHVCPACQSSGYKQVRPDRWVTFTWDRLCKSCGTWYTPPTPLWGSVIFILAGLPLAAFGLFAVVIGLARGNPIPIACEGAFGLLGVLAIVHGVRSLVYRGRV